MEIRGQKMLITGANRGIGRAVAVMAAETGAHLILANRTIDDELTRELQTAGAASVEQVRADLGSRTGVDTFLREHGAREIDILFNNAGQLTGGLFEKQPLDDILSMLQVNIAALIHLTHGFLPGMLSRRKGKIINHSSVSATMHFPCASTYAASKAAVSAFTHSLQAELDGTGVSTLLLVTPGVETRMFGEIEKKYGANLDVRFLRAMPPKQYAQRIREAILEDLTELRPSGPTGIGLALAQHLPGTFQKIVGKKFSRD